MNTELTILIVIIAFVAEFIDSSMGMMYGTLLSPLLIIMGFEPLTVVPSILLSQAAGGFTASMFHHKFSNANFRPKTFNPKRIITKIKEIGIKKSFIIGFTRDFKIVFIISALGIITTIFSALIAVNIPKQILTNYIGILVIIMGIVLLSKARFQFTWKKMLGIGILSSFNKGLSGGGFGPVVTAGQVIAGNDPKASIASTTLAEAPICVTAFITYYLTKGFTEWNFLLAMTLGSMAAAPLGAILTSKIDSTKFKPILGILSLILGTWVLFGGKS